MHSFSKNLQSRRGSLFDRQSRGHFSSKAVRTYTCATPPSALRLSILSPSCFVNHVGPTPSSRELSTAATCALLPPSFNQSAFLSRDFGPCLNCVAVLCV